MFNADLFGYAATAINLVMLLLQVLQTIKTKQTKDLSLPSLRMFLLACILWVMYGIAKNAMPVIFANGIVGVMNLVLVVSCPQGEV